MLRGIPFYGTATGTSLTVTWFDPILGASVSKIPKSGAKEGVAIRGVTFLSDTPAMGHYIELTIGQEPDYHKIPIYARGDADSPTAGPWLAPFQPLGDFSAKENFDLTGTAACPASAENVAGVLWYDDMEPELLIPRGRLVGLRYPGAADATASYASYGTLARKLDTDSIYYIAGVEVHPEDAVVQVLALHSSDEGLAAVAPPRGLMWFPSCPLKFDGLATLVQKAQVQAVTKVDVVWWAVEVPKRGGTSLPGLTPAIGALVQQGTPRGSQTVARRPRGSALGAIRRAVGGI